jgi:hypothetical protein
MGKKLSEKGCRVYYKVMDFDSSVVKSFCIRGNIQRILYKIILDIDLHFKHFHKLSLGVDERFFNRYGIEEYENTKLETIILKVVSEGLHGINKKRSS